MRRGFKKCGPKFAKSNYFFKFAGGIFCRRFLCDFIIKRHQKVAPGFFAIPHRNNAKRLSAFLLYYGCAAFVPGHPNRRLIFFETGCTFFQVLKICRGFLNRFSELKVA